MVEEQAHVARRNRILDQIPDAIFTIGVDGKIWLEKQAAGAKFCFTLPL